MPPPVLPATTTTASPLIVSWSIHTPIGETSADVASGGSSNGSKPAPGSGK